MELVMFRKNTLLSIALALGAFSCASAAFEVSVYDQPEPSFALADASFGEVTLAVVESYDDVVYSIESIDIGAELFALTLDSVDFGDGGPCPALKPEGSVDLPLISLNHDTHTSWLSSIGVYDPRIYCIDPRLGSHKDNFVGV